MSQLILDDELDVHTVVHPIQRWIAAERLRNLRPKQHVLDERVPAILLTLKQPTFVTIDHDFWDRRCCHPSYAILYFPLRVGEQPQLPNLLRAVLRQPGFRTRAERMGKVARVTARSIEYWQFPKHELQRVMWIRN